LGLSVPVDEFIWNEGMWDMSIHLTQMI